MNILTNKISFETKGENDVVDITRYVSDLVKKSEIEDGIVTIFVSGSTASVTTMEFEPGLVNDFPTALSRIAPTDIVYKHEEMWHDDNGRSHVKASLLGPSVTVPFTKKNLFLGRWQQIVIIEFDTRARKREVIIQVMGR